MSNNIASERVRLGWSQEVLAEKLGTTRDVVKSWECEEAAIKSSMLEKMADLFGCSIDYLLCRTDERLPHSRFLYSSLDTYIQEAVA